MKFKLLIILFCFGYLGFSQNNGLEIPYITSTISIDGVLAPNEWANAELVAIPEAYNRTAKTYLAYDNEYLYIAFTNLADYSASTLNAEVLINTSANGETWTEDTFWYHVSYSCCSARGIYYLWDNCFKMPSGWQANTFPLTGKDKVIEVKIKWSDLNMDISQAKSFKLGLKLSNHLDEHSYWPKGADIALPDSWRQVIMKP